MDPTHITELFAGMNNTRISYVYLLMFTLAWPGLAAAVAGVGVLVTKTVPLETSWRYLGGASFAFAYLRHLLLGENDNTQI